MASRASSRRRAGIALCLLSACGFGVMAIFGKEAYGAGLGVTTLLAGRFVLAAAAFWAIVAVRRPARPPRRVIVAGLALGSVGYAAQSGLFFSALERMDASLVSLLLYTYPALVFGAALLLGREHMRRTTLGALVLCSGGTALVLLGGSAGSFHTVGVALALGAALAYSTYILITDGIVARIDAFLLGALVSTGAAATFVAAGAVSGSLHFTSGGWIWIVAIALASTVLPISTFVLGLERVGAATAAIVSTVEPVVTVALAVALYGDALGALQLAGGAFVLAGVIALQVSRPGRAASSVPDHGAPALPAAAPAARALAREPA
ncbi:MAG: DMT family transporter [Solirubrobacteraceae bacterium]